jgi:hypothetical protein
MFKASFSRIVEKYLNSISPSEASRAKEEIIRLVRDTADPDARKQIKEVLAEINILPAWLETHFTIGSLYADRGLVFGWWRDDQIQAESLPVALSSNYFKGLPREMEVLANRNGFNRSVPLPLIDGSLLGVPNCRAVCVPDNYRIDCARYGWADALPLQWRRSWGAYIVDRSITSEGFWAAWKWWPGAANHYASNPPYPMAEKFDYCEKPDCHL